MATTHSTISLPGHHNVIYILNISTSDEKLKLRQQHMKSADFAKTRTHSIENCDTYSVYQAELNT